MWLEIIKDYIIANVRIEKEDIQEALFDKGGIIRARKIFGKDLDTILADMSLALVA